MCNVSSSHHAFLLVKCHAKEVTGAGARANSVDGWGSHSNQQQLGALERKDPSLLGSHWFPRRLRPPVVSVEKRERKRYP